METFPLIGSFHNLQLVRVTGPQRQDPLQEFPGISPISPNESKAQEAVAYPTENELGSIPILNVGCMDYYSNNQSQCVYQQMPLAAVDFLAGIISVKPPFSVVLTDWLSMIAALGSASRPSPMRSCARNVSWICVQVPSRRHIEKVMINNPPRGEIMRQQAPSTPCAYQIQDAVDDLQTLVLGWPATGFRHGNQWLHLFPLFHAQITRVRLPAWCCVTHGTLHC